MRTHSGALEQKWNRQLTRPISPAGAKNVVWGPARKMGLGTRLIYYQISSNTTWRLVTGKWHKKQL